MIETPGVIFDMDGVLVDSYQPHLQSWLQATSAIGLHMTEQDFARSFGRTGREIVAMLWPGKLTPEQIREFDHNKEHLYRQILAAHFPEMPGAGELIASLHADGFKLAIGSSGPGGNVELVRSKVGNGHLIDTTVHGREVKHGKPDPEIFLTAAQKLRLPPDRCAVIEDALVGLEAARRAGMAAIALTGTTPRDALAPHADLVVDCLRELTPAIIRAVITGKSKG